MNNRVRIADLPTSHIIDPDSYLIVERPGEGEGTYKCRLGDIQGITSVEADVKQVDEVTTIRIKDNRGETSATIITPTAKIIENSDNTYTIIITDAHGTTETTAVSSIVFDTKPAEGSENAVTSGGLWDIVQSQDQRFSQIETIQTDQSGLITNIQQVQTEQSTSISEIKGVQSEQATLIESLQLSQSDIESRLQLIERSLEQCLGIEASQPLP